MAAVTDKYACSKPTWQQQLNDAFTQIEDLCRFLQINPKDLPVSQAAAEQFRVKVPLNYAAKIQKGGLDDPLLQQILPLSQELTAYPGFTDDPVGDLSAVAVDGVLHKYQGRVLLINTGSCAIHCRYCFRRNFPYAETQLSKAKETEAIRYIAGDTSIAEVILSGGDPLTLSDERLAGLFSRLDPIKHVKRLRIHSRLPIVLPDRVTDDLADLLGKQRWQTILVAHCNHANEIDRDVIESFERMRRQNIILFNQAVLLRNVNDTADALCQLHEALFNQGVVPYYLHLLDKANGTAHFEVPEAEAMKLINQVRARLPGYMVPRLVKEVAGTKAKQAV